MRPQKLLVNAMRHKAPGRACLIRMLLQLGPPPLEETYQESGMTALSVAASNDDAEVGFGVQPEMFHSTICHKISCAWLHGCSDCAPAAVLPSNREVGCKVSLCRRATKFVVSNVVQHVLSLYIQATVAAVACCSWFNKVFCSAVFLSGLLLCVKVVATAQQLAELSHVKCHERHLTGS
jgi:hypothetical protein